MDALEAIKTCRAMRWLAPDPIPEQLLLEVLHAATCASSPGNSQGWDFVVVRDPGQRKRVGEAIRGALGPLIPEPAADDPPQRRRMLAGARNLVEIAERVPVWIFVCGRAVYPEHAPSAEWIPSTVYPAAQNLIVAARSLGLGSTFTAFHSACEAELREILALPDTSQICVSVPLGWPERGFGPVARRPLDEVVHWDRWSRD